MLPAYKVVTESLLALFREQAVFAYPFYPEVKFVLIMPSLDKVMNCYRRIHHLSSFTSGISLTEAALEMRVWVVMGRQLLPGGELAFVVGEVRLREEGQQICQFMALGGLLL